MRLSKDNQGIFLMLLFMEIILSPPLLFAVEQITLPKRSMTSVVLPGMEADTNRPGMDYRNYAAASAQQCQLTCNNEAQCKAWTWVKPVTQGLNGHCWLKTRSPAATKSDCCISGVRQTTNSLGIPEKMTATRTTPRVSNQPSIVKQRIPISKIASSPVANDKQIDPAASSQGQAHLFTIPRKIQTEALLVTGVQLASRFTTNQLEVVGMGIPSVLTTGQLEVVGIGFPLQVTTSGLEVSGVGLPDHVQTQRLEVTGF